MLRNRHLHDQCRRHLLVRAALGRRKNVRAGLARRAVSPGGSRRRASRNTIGTSDGWPSAWRMNPLNPKKLLLSKWTAVHPVRKDRHFLVTKVIEPLVAGEKIEWVEIEAVFSRSTQRVFWRDLQNEEVWKQGWA